MPSQTLTSPPQGTRSPTNSINLATMGAAVVINAADFGTLGVTFTGLTGSGAVLTYYASNDNGLNYDPLNSFNASTGVASPSRTVDGGTRFDVGGRTHVKIQVTTTGTGTCNIAYNTEVDSTLIVVTNPVASQAAFDFIDRSGTTTAGTNTFGTTAGAGFIVALATRQFLRIINRHASGTLFIYDKAAGTPNTATNCAPLAPGGIYIMDTRVPKAAIQIAGSVASMPYEAAEA